MIPEQVGCRKGAQVKAQGEESHGGQLTEGAGELFAQLRSAAVPDETPEESAEAETRAAEVNRACDAIDGMTESERQAAENRLRRRARRKGLILRKLRVGNQNRFGNYAYQLFDMDHGDAVVTGSCGLHLGEAQLFVKRWPEE